MLLPLSLFFNWFEIVSGPKEGDFTGWYSFDRTDRLLALLALEALASAFLTPRRLVGVGRVVLGLFAIVVVAGEMVSPPVIDPSTELRLGAYLGLAGALALTLGGAFAFDSVRRGLRSASNEAASLARRVSQIVRHRSVGPLRSLSRGIEWLRGPPEPPSGKRAFSSKVSRGLLRGVPLLSPGAFGLFRIAFGLALLWVMTGYVNLSDKAKPIEAQEASTELLEAGWIRWLGGSSTALTAIEAVTILALLCFVAGLLSRVAYALAALGFAITAWVLATVDGGAQHDWGLPTITVLSLLIVPWGASGLSLDAMARRRRGRTIPDAPSRRYGLSIWIPGFTMGVAFLAAAYAKLAESGFAWITGGAVKYHFIEDAGNAPTDWGLRLTGIDGLAVLMSFSGVMIEATFILVALSARPAIRLLFVVEGAALLTGFFLFQGVFWTPWWILLLALLPWEAIYRAGRRVVHAPEGWMADTASPVPLAGPLRVAALTLIAGVVAQQIAVSAVRLERFPFITNYPMYTGTWESEREFNDDEGKFTTYRFEAVEDAGDRVDRTAEIEAIRGDNTLIKAYEAREGESLEEGEARVLKRKLRALDARYTLAYGNALQRVYVVSERTAGYDFERAAFSTRVVGRRTQVVEPTSFEVLSVDGS